MRLSADEWDDWAWDTGFIPRFLPDGVSNVGGIGGMASGVCYGHPHIGRVLGREILTGLGYQG